jgi:4-hydroxybenzoate polyprenyltransferase
MLNEIIISMRPKQWYKNILIFIGIIFSMNVLNFAMWPKILAAFAIFCMVSGGEYIINDIIDIDKDRQHPKKRLRPITSGKLKVSYAATFAIALVAVAFWWAYSINVQFLMATAAYILLVLLYSIYLKHLVIVDVLTISMGFVVRAVAGCIAIKVAISPWLILCTFLVALFLAFGKRRNELIVLGSEAKNHRKILREYSTEMLDQMINVATGLTIMSYSLYTFLSGKTTMMLTIPFAVYGIFKYLFLIGARNFGGEPERLFKDTELVLCMILWLALAIMSLYGILDKMFIFLGAL